MDNLNKGLMTFASYNAGPGRVQAAPARGGKEGPRSQRLVRQRRARRLGADRPRNGDLRQQHLQVLHHLPPARRSAGAARGGEGASREQQVVSAAGSSRMAFAGHGITDQHGRGPSGGCRTSCGSASNAQHNAPDRRRGELDRREQHVCRSVGLPAHHADSELDRKSQASASAEPSRRLMSDAHKRYAGASADRLTLLSTVQDPYDIGPASRKTDYNRLVPDSRRFRASSVGSSARVLCSGVTLSPLPSLAPNDRGRSRWSASTNASACCGSVHIETERRCGTRVEVRIPRPGGSAGA